jgi:hypothetical protein
MHPFPGKSPLKKKLRQVVVDASLSSDDELRKTMMVGNFRFATDLSLSHICGRC